MDVVTVPGVIKIKPKVKNKLDCPVCGYIAQLVTEYNDFYVGKINKKIFFNFTNYQCDSCDESFTTTESDELNLKEINKGIRNFKRQLKIQKILK